MPRFTYFVILAALAGCAQGGQHAARDPFAKRTPVPPDHLPCQMDRVAELPYQLVDGHMVINTLIDNNPASLVFDTGAFHTVLTPLAAERLKLHRDSRRSLHIAGIGGERNAGVYSAHQIQLGRVKGVQWQFLVADIGHGPVSLGPDGLLGDDLLAYYDIDIDTQDKQLLLYVPHHDCSAPTVFLQGGNYTVAPLFKPVIPPLPPKTSAVVKRLYQLALENVPQPRINIEINGKTLVAGIDTGAPHTFLYVNGAIKMGLLPKDIKADQRVQEGGVGPSQEPAVRHMIQQISIGDLDIANQPVSVLVRAHHNSFDMILGMDIISRMHVWISHSSGNLIIQYPPTPSPRLNVPQLERDRMRLN